MTWHTSLGDVKFDEQIYRNHENKKTHRVIYNFGISQHGYSHKLQHKITYAGKSNSFDEAVKSLNIMSDLDIDKTAIRRITLQHGLEAGKYQQKYKIISEIANYVMAQTDGSMVPITTTKDEEDITEPSNDGRKNKKRIYKEIRLNYVQNNKGQYFYEADFIYKNDIKPFVSKALEKVGYKNGFSDIYAISDGAKWIYNTYKSIDKKAHYTVDFYHVIEKVKPMATPFIEKTPWDDVNTHLEKNWVDEIGSIIKTGKMQEVIAILNQEKYVYNRYEFCEYINNRPDCFDYPTLKAMDLPIGSGIIEGGHKNIIQNRIKKSGVGWKLDNAKNVINIRLLCANDLWDEYWEYYHAKCRIAA